MSTKLILDICSGTGAASEPFTHDPQWRVIRVDNDPQFKDVPFTRTLDIAEWPKWIGELELERFETVVIWFSPPCTDFSRSSMPWLREKMLRERVDWEPSMALVGEGLNFIDAVNPVWYCIENVRGSRTWFAPLLGPPSQIIGAYYLYGAFPRLLRIYEPLPIKQSKHGPVERARIPSSLSTAFYQAVTEQRRIDSF